MCDSSADASIRAAGVGADGGRDGGRDGGSISDPVAAASLLQMGVQLELVGVGGRAGSEQGGQVASQLSRRGFTGALPSPPAPIHTPHMLSQLVIQTRSSFCTFVCFLSLDCLRSCGSLKTAQGFPWCLILTVYGCVHI